MRTSLILIFILVFNLSSRVVHSQDFSHHRLYDATPHVVVKSNVLFDALLSFNLGAEIKLSKRYTLDVPVHYNPITWNNNRKWKHILVQPELRYWLCESFVGHFFGLHGHYANYNVGNIGPFRSTKDHRYRGWLAGGGLSWGYHFLLSPRWSMETTVGFGYAYLDYSKYESQKCGLKIEDRHKHYVGPTKLGLSLIYTLK